MQLPAIVARLLFIDDEIQLLYMIAAYFDSLGYDVVAAHGVDEAQQLIAHESFSLVISDLELCDPMHRRGFDVLAEVRRRDAAARTILLTSFGSPEARREAQALGIDLVLDKPQSLKQLAQIVAHMLEEPPLGGRFEACKNLRSC